MRVVVSHQAHLHPRARSDRFSRCSFRRSELVRFLPERIRGRVIDAGRPHRRLRPSVAIDLDIAGHAELIAERDDLRE